MMLAMEDQYGEESLEEEEQRGASPANNEEQKDISCSDGNCRAADCSGHALVEARCPGCDFAAMMQGGAKCSKHKRQPLLPKVLLVAGEQQKEAVGLVYWMGRTVCCVEEERDMTTALSAVGHVAKVTVDRQKQECVVYVRPGEEQEVLDALNDVARMGARLTGRLDQNGTLTEEQGTSRRRRPQEEDTTTKEAQHEARTSRRRPSETKNPLLGDDHAHVHVEIELTPVGRVVVRSRIRVSNMCCEMESELIKEKLGVVKGVESVSVNVVGRVAYVQHDSESVTALELCGLLNEAYLGATLQEAASAEATRAERLDRREAFGGLLLVLLFTVGVAGFYATHNFYFEALLVLLSVAGAVPVARRAVQSLYRQRRLDVNCLMLIAVAGALGLGDYVESAAVVVVFVLAEFVEGDCLRRVRNSLREVGNADDEKHATRVDGSRVETEKLQVGDTVCCRAGERVGVDGVVTKGKASVDESALTGEAMPVEKSEGSFVSAGTFVVNGYIEVRLTTLTTSTTLLRELVDEAQASTSPTQELVARFASRFTPLALTAALLVALVPIALGRHSLVWIERSLIVLVLACPCALILAAPIATVSAIGAAAKRGVLIKSAATLEALSNVDTIATDKTGTLTQGRCRVLKQVIFEEQGDSLRLAASLETRSTHPLATAIVNFAVGCIGSAEKILSEDVTDFLLVEGSGISGRVDGHSIKVGKAEFCGVERSMEQSALLRGTTTVFIAVDGRPSIALNVADPLRQEAASALLALARIGSFEFAMLTGDEPSTAEALLHEINADIAKLTDDESSHQHHQRALFSPAGHTRLDSADTVTLIVHASLKPAEKLAWVTEAQDQRGRHVLMIGDGVNDAPALAAASVGVAMGAGGSAMAVNAADLAIMSDNLDRLPETVRLAKFATKVIKQNIFIAIAIKLVVVVLAFTLNAELWMAVVADLGSLLIVVANGTRPLSFFKQEAGEAPDNETADRHYRPTHDRLPTEEHDDDDDECEML